MSTKDLINAIAAGDAQQIETTFETVMTEKISVALDAMRSSVAQNMFSEEVELDEEQLDELSKKTLDTYVKKARNSRDVNADIEDMRGISLKQKDDARAKIDKRQGGIYNANKRLAKEEVELDEEQIDEWGPSFYDRQIDAQERIRKQKAKAAKTLAAKGETPSKLKPKKAFEEVEFTLEDYSLSELEDFMLSEDFEQLDELSKSTLGSYIKKSKSNIIMHGSTLGTDINKRVKDKSAATMQKRAKGINKAVDKLTEDEEVVEEGYDSRGAYEKHDPKHPDFVKNYTKFKSANPKGNIGDFVAHMKKQK